MQKAWTICKCLQCGKLFECRMCYVKRGKGKFCSLSCSTTYRNTKDNPSKRPEVRKKISENHADVSGEMNPMYGVRGKDAPAYIDGRRSFKGETYRRILLASGRELRCEVCGSTDRLHVHHIDGNHKNNELSNLQWVCVNCHNNHKHKYIRDKKGRFTGSTLSEREEKEND